MEPIYMGTKWNRFIWKRNGTDIFGNEIEPNYLEPVHLETKWNPFIWERNGTDLFCNEM